MFFAGPAAHVGADLGDDLQRRLWADGIDLAQVGAAGEPMQRAADIELRLTLGSPRTARRRQWCRRWRLLVGQGGEQGLGFELLDPSTGEVLLT